MSNVKILPKPREAATCATVHLLKGVQTFKLLNEGGAEQSR